MRARRTASTSIGLAMSGVAQNGDGEVGISVPGACIPRRESLFDEEPSLASVRVECADGVAIRLASDDGESAGNDVRTDAGQDARLGVGSDVRHHVASQYRDVEGLWLTSGREIEFGKIRDDPSWPRMILTGRLDQFRIHIDADNAVTSLMENGPGPARPASRVEDPRMGSGHRIDQAGLACEVDSLSGHPAEPADVPL
mgnify:CR=1 FL=1